MKKIRGGFDKSSYFLNGKLIFMNSKTFGAVKRLGGLFVVGSLSALEGSCVSVAGSRKIDQSSSRWLENLIGQLDPAVTVVSGLALGADSVAHRAALRHGLPTVAVLPSGFDNITPRSNLRLARDIVANGGALVSEYTPATRATRGSFVARNRIIAQMGKTLVVPQFDVRSGTRHTVDFAQQMGKPIVVQNADYSGNQFVLRNTNYLTIAK